MADVTVSRTIAAPAETLFSMVADLPRMGEWSPEATGGTWAKGDGPGLGATFKGTNERNGRRWSTVATVTAYEPGVRFAFATKAGPLRIATWRYDFEPTDAGTTVTETYIDERGKLITVVGARLTGVTDRDTHNRQSMEATLAALDAAATA